MKFLINISCTDPSGVKYEYLACFFRLNKKQLGQLRSGIPLFPEISLQAFWPLEGRKNKPSRASVSHGVVFLGAFHDGGIKCDTAARGACMHAAAAYLDSHRPAPLRFAGRRDTTANDPKGCGIRASVLVVPVVVAYVKMQSDQNTPPPPPPPQNQQLFSLQRVRSH